MKWMLTLSVFLAMTSVVLAQEFNAGFVQGLWYGNEGVFAGFVRDVQIGQDGGYVGVHIAGKPHLERRPESNPRRAKVSHVQGEPDHALPVR